MKCAKCGYDIYEGTTCPLCGHENSSTPASTPTPTPAATETGTANYTSDHHDTGETSFAFAYSLKWYKFLKVLLWITIISTIYSAFTYLTGASYEGFEDKLYETLPSLKALDLFEGIYSIVMAVLTFIVWLALRNYKAIGPKLLTVMYLINAVNNAIYPFAFKSIIDGAETTRIYGSSYVSGGYMYQEYLDLTVLSSATIAPALIGVVSGIVMAIVNHIYFKNRELLFVN